MSIKLTGELKEIYESICPIKDSHELPNPESVMTIQKAILKISSDANTSKINKSQALYLLSYLFATIADMHNAKGNEFIANDYYFQASDLLTKVSIDCELANYKDFRTRFNEKIKIICIDDEKLRYNFFGRSVENRNYEKKISGDIEYYTTLPMLTSLQLRNISILNKDAFDNIIMHPHLFAMLGGRVVNNIRQDVSDLKCPRPNKIIQTLSDVQKSIADLEKAYPDHQELLRANISDDDLELFKIKELIQDGLLGFLTNQEELTGDEYSSIRNINILTKSENGYIKPRPTVAIDEDNEDKILQQLEEHISSVTEHKKLLIGFLVVERSTVEASLKVAETTGIFSAFFSSPSEPPETEYIKILKELFNHSIIQNFLDQFEDAGIVEKLKEKYTDWQKSLVVEFSIK